MHILKKASAVSTVFLVCFVAFMIVLAALGVYAVVNSSNYFKDGKSVNVVLTSVNVNIIYGGGEKDYFQILSQSPSCINPSSTGTDNCNTYSGPPEQAQFLVSIVLQTINHTSHAIGNISVITESFKGQIVGSLVFGNGGQTTFPITSYTGVSFTMQVSYIGKTNYDGNVTIEIYSPA